MIEENNSNVIKFPDKPNKPEFYAIIERNLIRFDRLSMTQEKIDTLLKPGLIITAEDAAQHYSDKY